MSYVLTGVLVILMPLVYRYDPVNRLLKLPLRQYSWPVSIGVVLIVFPIGLAVTLLGLPSWVTILAYVIGSQFWFRSINNEKKENANA